jgi:hypothetical protein
MAMSEKSGGRGLRSVRPRLPSQQVYRATGILQVVTMLNNTSEARHIRGRFQTWARRPV